MTSNSAFQPSTIAQAQQALRLGELELAYQTASAVREHAMMDGDVLTEAHALALLAHCDRLASRFRLSQEAAQRAAMLAHSIRDVRCEVSALSTLSYVASALGRNEDAVEAGLLSVALADTGAADDTALRAAAYNSLGVAQFYSGQTDESFSSLRVAIALASCEGSGMSPLQPTMNMACAESFRLLTARFHDRTLGDTGKFFRLMERAKGFASNLAVIPGMHQTVTAIVDCYMAIAECWQGQPEAALARLDGLHGAPRTQGGSAWVDCLRFWAMGECHWRLRNLDKAQEAMRKMVDTANEVEHEQIACMGHQFICQLCEERNDMPGALVEMRALLTRRHGIHLESLASRAQAVTWQVEMRANEDKLRDLRKARDALHLLAMSDPLTGLANRRMLESALEGLVNGDHASVQPLCVAFVDVDHFKLVNDKYSHETGDSVLRELAKVLRKHVRETDVAGRWAGDEFVVLLPRTSHVQASRLAERVAEAFGALEFPGAASGLQVTASIGVVEMVPGDTSTTLMNRADGSMYAAKRAR